MAGHTDNEILIAAPLDTVWQVANDIERWPELFPGEYVSATVIERTPDRVLFRLVTVPQQDGNSYSWLSERVLDAGRHVVNARRVETGPFLYMHIFQQFDEVPEGTRLRWVQDFEVLPGAPFTDAQMTDRINSNSALNLAHHRDYVERHLAAAS